MEEGCREYLKRLQPWASVAYIWTKDDAALSQIVQKEVSWVGLDLDGKEVSSDAFASFLEEEALSTGSRLNFVIGGPEGLPQSLKQKGALLSLSKMTFTHQMARLLLLEQVYRAFTLMKGIPYHK